MSASASRTPPSARQPVLIGLDWGTTSLRACLFDAQGTELQRRQAAQGILAVPEGGFRVTFEALCADWLGSHPDLPVVACGMVGSRQGWREAPYVHTPAGFEEIAGRLCSLDDLAGRVFRVIPGVQASSQMGAADVMRGEETQVFGALAAGSLLLAADAAHRDGLFVLPGTHSKWVEVRGHRIVALRTYLTGETYAVLRSHSILGRLCADPAPDDADAQEHARAAFDIGVQQGHAQPGALLHLLFMVRTEGLFERFTATQLPAYLSGLMFESLLIGSLDETASGYGLLAVDLWQLADPYQDAREVLARWGRDLHARPKNPNPATTEETK